MESKVYVFPDKTGYITRIDGGYTTPYDLNGWILIDEGVGDKYNLCQSNYFPESIITDGGAYRYKLVNGKPVECSAEEIAKQEEANKTKTIAPRNIMKGECITVDGVMYKATTNIPNGASIITGQNAIETTIEEQLYEMTKGE